MFQHLVKTLLAGERLLIIGLVNSWSYLKYAFDMQAEHPEPNLPYQPMHPRKENSSDLIIPGPCTRQLDTVVSKPMGIIKLLALPCQNPFEGPGPNFPLFLSFVP